MKIDISNYNPDGVPSTDLAWLDGATYEVQLNGQRLIVHLPNTIKEPKTIIVNGNMQSDLVMCLLNAIWDLQLGMQK